VCWITILLSYRRYHGVQTAASGGVVVRIQNTVVLFLTMVAAAASAIAQTPAAAAGTRTAPAGAATPASQDPAYYRIELAPSGSFVAIGALVTKGNAVLFHAYPDGKLMSLRKSDVRKVSPITAQEAAGPAKKDLVSIGNLAMQGGSAAPAAGASAGAMGTNNAAQPAGAPAPYVARPAATGPSVIPVRDGLAITTRQAQPD
jgi:hypothetical protein